MTSVNLQPRCAPWQRKEGFNFSALLDRVFQFGDMTSVAQWLHIQASRVHEWTDGTKRSPFEVAALVVERLRLNNNPNAELPFLALARELGYIAIRPETSADDGEFANVLREVSDVVQQRAEAERDGVVTPAERRAIAQQLSELIEKASAYRHAQLRQADEDER